MIVFRDAAGEYRWRALAANYEPVASGEGYVEHPDARDAAASLFPDAVIEDEAAE